MRVDEQAVRTERAVAWDPEDREGAEGRTGGDPGPVADDPDLVADVPDPVADVPGPVANDPSPVADDPSPVADDPDRIDDLADEITTLAAHIHAATHRLLTLLAAFDRLNGWEREGHRSCAHWLAFRTGIDLGAAREKVRAARALEDLPETSAAMARGSLSFAKVRALTRVATPENEGDLLELARGSTAAELERMVRGWRLLNRKDEADLERIRHASRTLAVVPDNDGMYVVRGRLDPEVGALLLRAVEAAGDALYARETAGGAPRDCVEPECTPAQRRADALGLLAERAMAAGFGRAKAADPNGRPETSCGTRAARYQVVLHVEAATLELSGDPGRSELEDGTRVAAETSRRVACDASLVEVRHGAGGEILDVGRRRRTVPPAIRRALESRDRGCRFPGCGSRFTDAHHVVHWADGGETKLDNLVLLCRVHHRRLHEEGYRLELNPWPGGRPVFYDRRGLPVPEAPPVTDVGSGAVEALMRANRNRGVRPSWGTASCRWKSEDDIPLEVIERAEEAA